MFNLDNILVVCFNEGFVNGNINNIIYDLLLNWLDNFEKLIKDKKQILLCGHSNGMSAATITSFILLYLLDSLNLSVHKYYIEENKEIFDHLFSIKSKWSKLLENIEIFVIGSGGFPVIFTKEDQFIDYYNSLKGKYLHLSTNIYTEIINKNNNEILKINEYFNSFLGSLCYEFNKFNKSKLNCLDRDKSFCDILKFLPINFSKSLNNLYAIKNEILNNFTFYQIYKFSEINEKIIKLKYIKDKLKKLFDIIDNYNYSKIDNLEQKQLITYIKQKLFDFNIKYTSCIDLYISSLELYNKFTIVDSYMKPIKYSNKYFYNFKFSVYSKITNNNNYEL
jgi:hypothetical protein